MLETWLFLEARQNLCFSLESSINTANQNGKIIVKNGSGERRDGPQSRSSWQTRVDTIQLIGNMNNLVITHTIWRYVFQVYHTIARCDRDHLSSDS